MEQITNQNIQHSLKGSNENPTPLCVDLDGNLINTDTLLESITIAFRNWRYFKVLLWITKGKAKFKAKLAEEIVPNPALLPYNKSVLNYLKKQKAMGRYLVLATASDRKIALSVNQHLNLFDEVIASDGKNNLRGAKKAKALIDRFGIHGFSYLGNDRTDLEVWKSPKTGVLVNASKSLSKQAEHFVKIEARLSQPKNKIEAILKEIRPHHWLKNLLVFVPIILANAFTDFEAWLQTGIVFISLCATASAIYVINDIFNIEADRQHSSKRNRPIACGSINIKEAFVLISAMLFIGIILSHITSTFLLVLTYAVTGLAYSIYLKKLPLVDIFTLAGFYTIRLFIGGVASGHLVSFWLLAFSIFLFLSLAIIKRLSELKKLVISSKENLARRGYFNQDADILQAMGVCSSFVSTVVLALYVQSDVGCKRIYSAPDTLGHCPYNIILAMPHVVIRCRGNMHDDPVVYAAKDKVTWAVGLTLLIIILTANIPV